jgi:hypothetical protein
MAEKKENEGERGELSESKSPKYWSLNCGGK